jgi:hypothetical protein
LALLYHFNSSKHALSNIKKKALKVSLIDRLNDPFECRPAGVLDHDLNEALDGVRTDIAKSIGMLCLSRDWKHPLMWGHYADSHAGICLGFEFTGPKESRVAVDYEAERIVNLVWLCVQKMLSRKDFRAPVKFRMRLSLEMRLKKRSIGFIEKPSS